VTREGKLFVLDFPARPAAETDTPAGLIEALGDTPETVLKSRDLLVIFNSESQLIQLRPDFRAISELGVHAVIVTAPGENSDFVSRFFAPGVGVDEDPVT